jgi:hypothetical protein
MPLDYNQVEERGMYMKGEEKILVLNKHQVTISDGIEYRYVYSIVGQPETHYSVPYQGNEVEHLITT